MSVDKVAVFRAGDEVLATFDWSDGDQAGKVGGVHWLAQEALDLGPFVAYLPHGKHERKNWYWFWTVMAEVALMMGHDLEVENVPPGVQGMGGDNHGTIVY